MIELGAKLGEVGTSGSKLRSVRVESVTKPGEAVTSSNSLRSVRFDSATKQSDVVTKSGKIARIQSWRRDRSDRAATRRGGRTGSGTTSHFAGANDQRTRSEIRILELKSRSVRGRSEERRRRTDVPPGCPDRQGGEGGPTAQRETGPCCRGPTRVRRGRNETGQREDLPRYTWRSSTSPWQTRSGRSEKRSNLERVSKTSNEVISGTRRRTGVLSTLSTGFDARQARAAMTSGRARCGRHWGRGSQHVVAAISRRKPTDGSCMENCDFKTRRMRLLMKSGRQRCEDGKLSGEKKSAGCRDEVEVAAAGPGKNQDGRRRWGSRWGRPATQPEVRARTSRKHGPKPHNAALETAQRRRVERQANCVLN